MAQHSAISGIISVESPDCPRSHRAGEVQKIVVRPTNTPEVGGVRAQLEVEPVRSPCRAQAPLLAHIRDLQSMDRVAGVVRELGAETRNQRIAAQGTERALRGPRATVAVGITSVAGPISSRERQIAVGTGFQEMPPRRHRAARPARGETVEVLCVCAPGGIQRYGAGGVRFAAHPCQAHHQSRSHHSQNHPTHSHHLISLFNRGPVFGGSDSASRTPAIESFSTARPVPGPRSDLRSAIQGSFF